MAFPAVEKSDMLLPSQEQASIHRQRASRLFQELRISEALAELEQAVRQDGRDAESWRLLAEIYGAAGYHEQAASYIQNTLAEDHTDMQAWVMLANIYCQIGGHFLDLALEQLQAVPEPDHPDVQYLLGNIFAQMGEKELADRHLSRALELDPSHRFARHDLDAVRA